jgi:hypothetical protein
LKVVEQAPEKNIQEKQKKQKEASPVASAIAKVEIKPEPPVVVDPIVEANRMATLLLAVRKLNTVFSGVLLQINCTRKK